MKKVFCLLFAGMLVLCSSVASALDVGVGVGVGVDGVGVRGVGGVV